MNKLLLICPAITTLIVCILIYGIYKVESAEIYGYKKPIEILTSIKENPGQINNEKVAEFSGDLVMLLESTNKTAHKGFSLSIKLLGMIIILMLLNIYAVVRFQRHNNLSKRDAVDGAPS